MTTSITRTRRIELRKQGYSLIFNNRSGARAKCSVLEGEGILTLYEIKRTGKFPVGNPQLLSLKPGNSFYIALKTDVKNSKWEVELIGDGRFKLEIPAQEHLEKKRINKIDKKQEYKEKRAQVKAKDGPAR
jgi:hypothetical protein